MLSAVTILPDQLMKYRLGKRAVQGIKIWHGCWSPRVVMSGMKSSWQPVSPRVQQVVKLGSIVFNRCTYDMQGGRDCTLRKSSDNTQLWGQEGVYRADRCAAVQRDVTRVETWADRNIMSLANRNALGEEECHAPLKTGADRL